MIILHSFGSGFGLQQIIPFVTGIRLQFEVGRRALAAALERIVERYVERALQGARWAGGEELLAEENGLANLNAPALRCPSSPPFAPPARRSARRVRPARQPHRPHRIS